MVSRARASRPARPDSTTGRRGRLHRLLIVGMLVPAFAASAIAAPSDEAAAAYQRGDYPAAARLYRSLAEHGDASAQNAVGAMYLHGQGVKRNFTEALKWFRRAAALGSAPAQFNVAEMYFKGRGTEPDLLQAARWYARAAEQGHPQAQFTLAALYLIGSGVPQSKQKAAYWFQRAAAQGHAEAQVELGKMYGSGQGVPKNMVSAYKWLAVSRAHARNGATRTSAGQALQQLAANMTPAQISQAQRQASEWRATPSKVR